MVDWSCWLTGERGIRRASPEQITEATRRPLEWNISRRSQLLLLLQLDPLLQLLPLLLLQLEPDHEELLAPLSLDPEFHRLSEEEEFRHGSVCEKSPELPKEQSVDPSAELESMKLVKSCASS